MATKAIEILPDMTLSTTAPVKKFISYLKDFVSRYPAIIASYFIYGYYFVSTMDFYIKFKRKHFGTSEALSHFDTLIWMWILAWALVRVMELRERLHKKETENLAQQHTIQLKETQLRTLHEVVMTLKHQINNPLAIILGYVRMAQKKSSDPEISTKLNEIEIAAQRINTAMKEFSLVRVYEVEESPVGNLVQLPSEKQ